MALLPFRRHPANPIVQPGRYPWRQITVFNPAVVLHRGRFLMLERTAGQLRPFVCYLGALESRDGVNFEPLSDQPAFAPDQLGYPQGSIQDPRIVELDGRLAMTYAFRKYAWCVSPTGYGVPDSWEPEIPGHTGAPDENLTISGIALSDDGLRWEHLTWTNPAEVDDRDVILFPEKVGGKYWLLRRPRDWFGPEFGTPGPSIWIASGGSLTEWSEAQLLARPMFGWENNRIGGSTPPIRTEAGWLLFYHGVETTDPARKSVVYRMGAMMLDGDDPTRVIARCPDPVMEPESYEEKFGLFIPNVIFPTANVVIDGEIWLYYGVCDTAISLATIPLRTVVDHVMAFDDEGRVRRA